MSALTGLPPKASYDAHKGRARVRIERHDTTIVITATCDSLQRVVDLYASQATRYQAQITELSDRLATATKRAKIKRTRAPTFLLYDGIVVIILAAVALCVYVIKKQKRLWQ